MLAAPLIALARSSCLPACLVSLHAARTLTYSLSLFHDSISLHAPLFCALPPRETLQFPPATTLYLLSGRVPGGLALGFSSPPPRVDLRPLAAAGQTITAYYSACNRAEHRLCYDSHSSSPAAVRDAANALTLNRMHDLFQLETLLPGAGAPSNANLHLRLAADDRCHHRGQCILNRTTIATSSARRDT
jgi:hypothetical protein